jgi:hypothetical protein
MLKYQKEQFNRKHSIDRVLFRENVLSVVVIGIHRHLDDFTKTK